MRSSTDSGTASPFTAPGAARARRSPRLVILGLLCSLLGALGVSASVSAAQDSTPVVALARAVPRGQVIQRADLRVVTVGALPGIRAVPGEELATVVGRTALVDLSADSILPAGSFGQPTMPRDSSQLGLRLEAGRLPSTSLTPGSRVLLVEVVGNRPGEDSGTTVGRTWPATLVSAPRTLADGASWTLDVSVAVADAPQVANLAAAGRLALVKVA